MSFFFSSLFGRAPAKPHTGSTCTAEFIRQQLPGAICGKLTYALVREDYILGLLDRSKTALSKSGIRQWQPTATCTLYALAAVALALQEYYAAAFHDASPAPALAAGSVWFRPDSGGGHAINVFITPTGPRFADPQVATAFRTLSAAEFGSRYLTVFQ